MTYYKNPIGEIILDTGFEDEHQLVGFNLTANKTAVYARKFLTETENSQEIEALEERFNFEVEYDKAQNLFLRGERLHL